MIASAEWRRARREIWADIDDSGVVESLSATAGHLDAHFSPERPLVLPTCAGRWRRAFLAQRLQARADASRLEGKKVALVASRQWRFPSELVAQRLGAVTPLWLELKGLDWTLPHLATRLAHDANFKILFRAAIASALRNTHADILLFPPLFIDEKIADDLGRELGVEIAELVATTEPAAGKRLTDSIARTLRALEIPQHTVHAVHAETARGTVLALHARSPAAPQFRAAQFVLATGKFFGGGITDTGEPIFHSPVFARGPTAGVRVNAKWQPIDAYGVAPLENVAACGSVIGGLDFAAAGFGAGFMAHLGRRCGREI